MAIYGWYKSYKEKIRGMKWEKHKKKRRLGLEKKILKR